ncbi:MAG TPA: CpsD/CapB family tyrosine-protein kinase [Vicinamibacterales bacterium]|jgi:capsular exopolysaccharide synthesis family protein
MSRIQEILKKAERDGAVHRTRALGADLPTAGTSGAGAAALAMPMHAMSTSAPAVEPVEATPVAVRLDHRLVSALAPQSPAAEQYRSLRTRIKNAEHGRTLRSIVVTSPNKGDGKSLTAANLALAMAQDFQQRVLLVDGDLRRPAIHHLFGISDSPGLADVLTGAASLDDALVAVADHHLSVLPSGPTSSHPAELLGSIAMRRTLDALRTRYDRIIIDMPPVAPLADVSIALGMVDGLLMIVRAGVTPKPAIERALAGLDTNKVVGLVLNDAGDGASSYLGGYHYVAG